MIIEVKWEMCGWERLEKLNWVRIGFQRYVEQWKGQWPLKMKQEKIEEKRQMEEKYLDFKDILGSEEGNGIWTTQ